MNRESFERVVVACCRHLEVEELTIIGSQALFGSFEDLREEPGAVSFEVDIVLAEEAARDDVAALFGELSPFHDTWGIYADPVDVTTGRFPRGWTERLVTTTVTDHSRSRTYSVHCPERHDLCVAKLIAGRPKDRQFVASLVAANRVDADLIIARVGNTDLDLSAQAALVSRLQSWLGSSGHPE